MRIDDYGFFGNSNLDFTRFQVPGKYQITFRYSTKSSKIQQWVGLEAPPAKDSEVAKLFGQVPKFETKSNTIELTFGPPPGGYVPGFKTPLSRAKSMGAHFLRLTLGQRPIHPPQMDVVWLVDGIPDDVSLHTDPELRGRIPGIGFAGRVERRRPLDSSRCHAGIGWGARNSGLVARKQE